MPIKLKPIKDPGLTDKDGKQTSVPISPPLDDKMKLRGLVVKQHKNNKVVDISTKTTPPDSKLAALNKISGNTFEIKCQTVCERALEAIESVDNHKFFCIGKGANRMYCGSVVHRVPMGAYARIGSGQCVCLDSPPVEKDGSFKYEKDRQLAVKVNKNVVTDYLVVVSSTGVIFVGAGACAALNMPVFVVEQTGEYYKLSKGKRTFSLMSGNHLLIYTYQVPILFPRVDYKAKPMIRSAIIPKIDAKKSTEKKKSDEKKEDTIKKTTDKEEPKGDVPKKPEPKKPEPKKEEPKKVESKSAITLPSDGIEDSKDDLKEKEDNKKEVLPKEEPFKPFKFETKKPQELTEESKEDSKEDSKNDFKEEEKKEEPVPPVAQTIQPAAVEEPVPPVAQTIQPASVEESMPPVTQTIEPPALEEPEEVATNQTGLQKAKIIGFMAAIVIGIVFLYLFFGASKGEDKDKNQNKQK